MPDPATPRQRASLSQRKELPKPHAPRRDDGKHASPGFAGQHIGGAGASKREKPDLQIKRSGNGPLVSFAGPAPVYVAFRQQLRLPPPRVKIN